jgi:hypothetical protein
LIKAFTPSPLKVEFWNIGGPLFNFTFNLGINRILIQILDVEIELPSPFSAKHK